MSRHIYGSFRDEVGATPTMDYNAAKSSRYRRRRTGLLSSGSSADYHYKNENDYLRFLEYARDMDRNDAIVGQLVDRVVDNTVQNGFRLQPDTGDKGLDTELWSRWDEWSNDENLCDSQGEFCFSDMERLAFREMIVDGDDFFLPLESGELEMVESHRCRSPNRSKRQNLVNGVLLDGARKRLQYWFTKDDIDPTRSVLVSDVKPYDARDKDGHKQVFQIYNPKRSTQTRGVTAFAPIFDHCGMMEDSEFARMVQQQVVSCFGFIEDWLSANSADLPSVDDVQLGERTTQQRSDGTTATIDGIKPGMVLRPPPGKKYTHFNANVPNPEFFTHMRHILQLIGVNLGMPLVLVLLDASDTNFSGWRGAVDQARLGFRRNQRCVMRRLHCPAYRWKVRQWMVEDPPMRKPKSRKIKIFNHKWGMPRWPYIEPMTDTQANILRVAGGQTSPRRLHDELDQDWDDIYEEMVSDTGAAIRRAKKEAEAINKEYPDDEMKCTWRDCLNLPLSEGVRMSLAGPQPPKEEKAQAKNTKNTNGK